MVKIAVVVFLAVVACANGLNIGRGPSTHLLVPDPHVVGGHDAEVGQFPHIITMKEQDPILGYRQHHCGGSILSTSWILTAAHCVVGINPAVKIVIIAGVHNMSAHESSEQESFVAETIVHEMFPVDDFGVFPYDIALIRLSTPFTFNDRVKAIALPPSGSIPSGNSTLSGWGSTTATAYPDILKTVDVPIVSLEECIAVYGDKVEDTMVCTGPLTGGVSACTGDSGGPLIQYNEVPELIGIVSFGIKPCGTVGAPTVYTRVSAFNDWILEKTGPL